MPQRLSAADMQMGMKTFQTPMRRSLMSQTSSAVSWEPCTRQQGKQEGVQLLLVQDQRTMTAVLIPTTMVH